MYSLIFKCKTFHYLQLLFVQREKIILITSKTFECQCNLIKEASNICSVTISICVIEKFPFLPQLIQLLLTQKLTPSFIMVYSCSIWCGFIAACPVLFCAPSSLSIVHHAVQLFHLV